MEEVYANYAQALYSLADPSALPDYEQAMEEIRLLFEKEPAFLRLLSGYTLGNQEKEKLIDQVFSSFGLPYLLDFLKLLSAKHRISHFDEIEEAFASLCHERFKVKEGIAYSAVPLSKEQLSSIEEALSKKLGAKVRLRNQVDQVLLGGVKVALDGKVYDGSLRSKLLGLKKSLEGGSVS